MHLHPRKNNHGKPVQILAPHTPTSQESWGMANEAATVVPDGPMPQALHGIPFAPWRDAPEVREGWSDIPGQAEIAEPPFDPEGKDPSAGTVILEPDGRVWLVAPTKEYGGYKATFPKGRTTKGLSLQATAIKETYEETGLKVMITAHLVDVPRSTTTARYYLAQRVAGTPSEMGWESQAVHLVHQGRLGDFLNNKNDAPILAAIRAFSSRSDWNAHVVDFLGVARRACLTIQGFAGRFGRWPSRLLVAQTEWNYIRAQLTPLGFEELSRKLAVEIQDSHTLAVADAEGRFFDYNAEEAWEFINLFPTSAITTWLWGVLSESTAD